MPNLTPMQQRNRELADKLLEESKQNPSGFAGKFVGIANGQVVVVTDDLNELGSRLRNADPNPANSFWFEIGRDYTETHMIWEVASWRAPSGH
jgi:hypothetical protein